MIIDDDDDDDDLDLLYSRHAICMQRCLSDLCVSQRHLWSACQNGL